MKTMENICRIKYNNLHQGLLDRELSKNADAYRGPLQADNENMHGLSRSIKTQMRKLNFIHDLFPKSI